LLAISCLVVAISIYAYNSIPTWREDVSISKMEFQKNEIDLDFDDSNDIEPCTELEYKNQLNLLKKAMPKGEWKNLGDSVETTEYEYVEKYDSYYGYEYYDRVPYTVKQFKRNDDAIPNIIDDVFESKGVDTFQMCARISTIKLIGALNVYVKPESSTKFLQSEFKSILTYNQGLKTKNVKDVARIFMKIEGKQPKFVDAEEEEDNWHVFNPYLGYFDNDTINDERIEFIIKTIGTLKGKKIKDNKVKHSIAAKIMGSSLEDNDIFNACDDFFTSKDILYSEVNVMDVFNKYLRLYKNKVKLAEKLLLEEEAKKEEKKGFYKYFALYSFASILSIATILILFSIRNTIKDKE